MTAARALPARRDVPVAETWNLESVFATDAGWEREFEALWSAAPDLERFRGRLGESGTTLLAALSARDALAERVERVASFAAMRRVEDETNPHYAALADRARALDARARTATAYVEPELLAIPPERLTAFVTETPGLAIYGHAFARLDRLRPHVRSAEVEETLALATELAASPEKTQSVLENADMTLKPIRDEAGNEAALAVGSAEAFMRSPDRGVRRAAWASLADGYLGLRHTFAATLAGAVQRDVFHARVRRYPSSLEAALAPNAIPARVFHTLLETVWRHFPVWQRYFRLRAKILGVDRIGPWDLHAPLLADDPKVTFAEASELIARGLAPLGEEYGRIMRQGIADRWVDRSPNVGKSGGAFSAGSPGTAPFIMMNWSDDVLSLGTLAHELGHSMHSYYAWQTQPYVYTPYSMFVAETASNMHQALVGEHLLASDRDDSFKIAVIEERMANYLRYLFIMPILARFELDCHARVEAGGALTADSMSATLLDLYRQGYGDAVETDDARVGIVWAQFPHLFANFYVFQYATGISAAAALAEQVRRDGEPAARRYVDFLKAGDSLDPIDALKLAGVDMTSPEPVERAFANLDRLVDRLATLTAPLSP